MARTRRIKIKPEVVREIRRLIELEREICEITGDYRLVGMTGKKSYVNLAMYCFGRWKLKLTPGQIRNVLRRKIR